MARLSGDALIQEMQLRARMLVNGSSTEVALALAMAYQQGAIAVLNEEIERHSEQIKAREEARRRRS